MLEYLFLTAVLFSYALDPLFSSFILQLICKIHSYYISFVMFELKLHALSCILNQRPISMFNLLLDVTKYGIKTFHLPVSWVNTFGSINVS